MKLPYNRSGEHKTDRDRLAALAPCTADSKRRTTEFVRAGAAELANLECDECGFITVWTQGAERIFGYEPGEAIGKHIALVYCADDLKHGRAVYELLAASTRGSYATAGWQRRKNGQEFWAQSENRKTPSGFSISFIERSPNSSSSDLHL